MNAETMLAMFLALERAGLRTPYDDAEGAMQTAAVWLRVFGDLPGVDLGAAVTAWLRSEKGKWWPKPSELLALVPRQPAPPRLVLEDHGDWPGRAWSEIEDGNERVRLMDQACALVRSARPCGQDRCAIDCEPCLDAMAIEADRLAMALPMAEASA